jgi:hypothetical protein
LNQKGGYLQEGVPCMCWRGCRYCCCSSCSCSCSCSCFSPWPASVKKTLV